MAEVKLRITRDIWLVAWLEIEKQTNFKNYKLIDNRRAEFHYDIVEPEWIKLKLEFYGSYVAKIKNTQERLKDLFY